MGTKFRPRVNSMTAFLVLITRLRSLISLLIVMFIVSYKYG